jgi:hypothetical protein
MLQRLYQALLASLDARTGRWPGQFLVAGRVEHMRALVALCCTKLERRQRTLRLTGPEFCLCCDSKLTRISDLEISQLVGLHFDILLSKDTTCVNSYAAHKDDDAAHRYFDLYLKGEVRKVNNNAFVRLV